MEEEKEQGEIPGVTEEALQQRKHTLKGCLQFFSEMLQQIQTQAC